ncbi:MAG: hypothetical protein ACOY93_21260 [Bacillota bacterium]
MIIRQLTADEKAAAQKARDEANERIKTWRAKRIEELKTNPKFARKDEREREATAQFPLMTAVPVKLTDGEHCLTVDFDPLYRFCRSLRSPNWTVTGRMQVRRGRVEFSLSYHHQDGRRRGEMATVGLPAKHLQALEGLNLPTIQIASPDLKEGTTCAS